MCYRRSRRSNALNGDIAVQGVHMLNARNGLNTSALCQTLQGGNVLHKTAKLTPGLIAPEMLAYCPFSLLTRTVLRGILLSR